MDSQSSVGPEPITDPSLSEHTRPDKQQVSRATRILDTEFKSMDRIQEVELSGFLLNQKMPNGCCGAYRMIILLVEEGRILMNEGTDAMWGLVAEKEDIWKEDIWKYVGGELQDGQGRQAVRVICVVKVEGRTNERKPSGKQEQEQHRKEIASAMLKKH